MPGFVTRRPNNHHHSINKKSDRLEAHLTIVPPYVLYRNRRTSKDDRCIGKIRPPLAESSLPFFRIKDDFHTIKCTPI